MFVEGVRRAVIPARGARVGVPGRVLSDAVRLPWSTGRQCCDRSRSTASDQLTSQETNFLGSPVVPVGGERRRSRGGPRQSLREGVVRVLVVHGLKKCPVVSDLQNAS